MKAGVPRSKFWFKFDQTWQNSFVDTLHMHPVGLNPQPTLHLTLTRGEGVI